MAKELLWFKRKRYGWGWRPVTWQGWTLLIIYMFLTILLFTHIDLLGDALMSALIMFMLLTATLIIICYLTGEKPRWQWGERPKEK